MMLFWVIGGGLMQVPLIEEARALGYQVIVTDANPSCACSSLSDLFFAVDIFDSAGHVELADRLKKEGHFISGVLAAGIDAPETMAVLNKHLGLPGVSPDIARCVNHKDLFRSKMVELGQHAPKFRVVTEQDIDNLTHIISEIGYPLIVKNTSSSGSRGTQFFLTPDFEGIKIAIFSAIAVSRSRKALIESVWIGSEHTVETLFDCDGNFYPCFITDRLFDYTSGYPIETGLIHPSQLSSDQQVELYALAESVARQMGITVGAAKYDIIYTQEGPRIIEMTVRLSGGFDCQYVVPIATGKNILKAAILTALGKPFDPLLLEDTKHCSVITESIWPEPGVFKALEGLEIAKKLPGFEHCFLRYSPGQYIEPYIDCTKRFCFILVSGSNLDQAKKNMLAIKSVLNVVTV